ncbi:beta-lactamase [Akanthomyces lecanii RCEF 1005]|uniref:Beta-lactamase n=1 Tax=Akanthomyces lecanii RCEF 1005 TaxID=1081108 RepID=A0A162N3A6_CORDF|nr:beta-lactamase [Akanthomyces lecanii RCEF 1005]
MEKLNAILQDAVPSGEDATGKVLGAAFIVTNKDDFLYSGAAGRIGLDDASPAFSADSFTWIASMSKVVTATCLMQLVERGLVSLDDDVRPRFPEMQAVKVLRGFEEDGTPMLEENTEPITLRMLLSHTSGYPYEFSNPRALQWSQREDRKDKFPARSRAAIDTPLVYAPGEYWNYGTGPDWAGELLALVTGQPLGTYMQERIFAPLGMQDTGFHPSRLPHVQGRIVTDVVRRGGRLESDGPIVEDWTMEGGGGGLFSTASDFAKFLRGLLAGRLLGDAALDELCAHQLSPKQVKGIEAFTYDMGVHGIVAPEFPRYARMQQALGGMVNVDDVPGKRRKGSISWSGASGPRWWVDRETGIAGVMMLNVIEYDPAASDAGAPPSGLLWQKLETATYGDLLK